MRRLAAVVATAVLTSACSSPSRMCGRPTANWTDVGEQLFALEEAGVGPAEEYRLIYMPSFGLISTARVSRDGAVFKGASAFAQSCPDRAERRPVATEEWKALRADLEELGFWTLDEVPWKGRAIEDGAGFNLAGVQDGKFHALGFGSDGITDLFLSPKQAAAKRIVDRMMRLSGAPLLWFARD